MKVEFKFNSRSSGQNVPEAIRLAEKRGGYKEDKFYKVYFDSPEDMDLDKLFKLVGGLKGTAISLDGNEPVVAHKFFYAVNCQEKLICKGICRHLGFYCYNLDTFVDEHSDSIENDVFTTSEEHLITSLTSFLEMVEENKFRLNKTLFFEFFQEETEMERRFCNKYHLKNIETAIEKLPNEIKLVPEEVEDYGEEFELEETEDRIEYIISSILTESKLSSELPFKDILLCSKTVGLLQGGSSALTVEKTDIVVYSFPSINKVIIAKLLVFSNSPDELEEDELSYTIKKQNEFFVTANPHSKLYFQLFEEDDAMLEGYFEKLRNIYS